MSIKTHVFDRVVEQFHHPRGLYGRVAGRIMATRESNVSRNRWIAGILRPAPGARILEIGHGPGVAIEALVPHLDGGHLTGLEISELMSRSAARRNKRAVASGVVDFRVGDSADPPDDLRDFDLIYAVNASMFWADPAAAVDELASRLAPGGELVFAFMPPPTSTSSAEEVADYTGQLFARVGLTDIRHEEMNSEPPTIATRGTRLGVVG